MTMRSVQDRFWSDGWVRKLNPLDRYLFLYLITNEHTNWCGVYELEMGQMAFETGIDERELERSMLPRLSPKIVYVDGWVWVPNWTKHHMSESGTLSPQQKEGVRKAMEKIPHNVRAVMKEIESGTIPYTYPMVGVSPSSLSSSLSLNAKSSDFDIVEEVEGEPRVPKDSDPLIGKAATWWHKKCKEQYSVEPSGGLAKTKKILKTARQSLEWVDIQQMMQEWFDNAEREPKDMIQITQCLSPYQIDQYLTKDL